jgi:hypothetical protein
MKAKAITASIGMPGGAVSAEFHIDTGFTVASVAGNSRWGTRPREADIRLVVENFILQRFGMTAYRSETSCAQ